MSDLLHLHRAVATLLLVEEADEAKTRTREGRGNEDRTRNEGEAAGFTRSLARSFVRSLVGGLVGSNFVSLSISFPPAPFPMSLIRSPASSLSLSSSIRQSIDWTSPPHSLLRVYPSNLCLKLFVVPLLCSALLASCFPSSYSLVVLSLLR